MLTKRNATLLPADAGQAVPLPLPREGEGRTAPLPTPREGDGGVTPLPVTPRVSDAPVEGKPKTPEARETFSITRAALDYYYDRAQDHFVRLNNMSAALKLAARDAKARIVKTGRVFDLKPPTAIESYLESRALRKRDGTADEPANVAARRSNWDQAKRSGDAGAMTTTANALVCAVEEARSHLGTNDVLAPVLDHSKDDVDRLDIASLEEVAPEERDPGLTVHGSVQSPSLLSDAYATNGEHLFASRETHDAAEGESSSVSRSVVQRGADPHSAVTATTPVELTNATVRQSARPRAQGKRPSDRDIADARALAGQLPISGSSEPTPVW